MLNESGYTLGDCWAWMFAHNANKMIDAINGDTDDAKWKAWVAFEKTIAPLGEDRITELLSGQGFPTYEESTLFANALVCSVEDLVYTPHHIVGTLPRPYRKIACEFLSKHQAFDTEFTAKTYDEGFTIEWRDICGNRAHLCFCKYYTYRWHLSWIDNATMGSVTLNELKVSQDFRNFIQQFKSEVQN